MYIEFRSQRSASRGWAAAPVGLAVTQGAASVLLQLVHRQIMTVEPDDGVLNASLVVQNEAIGFAIYGVARNDRLVVTEDRDGRVSAKLHHRSGRDCRVVCADQTEGRPCANCTAGGVTVRICC